MHAGQSGFLAYPDGKGFAFIGNAMQDAKILGEGIAKVKQQGTVTELSQKYFGDIDVTVK